MRPVNFYLGGFVIACLLAVMASWVTTIRAVDERMYYQKKYEEMIVQKDAEILCLLNELNKAETFDDWHVLWRYALPEIKQNEMLKQIPSIAYRLREHVKEDGHRGAR